MIKKTARGLLWIAGFISLGIGITGIVTPMLPGFPFLLLSAYCFAQSDERMHRWIMEHKIFGKMIHDWTEHRMIRKKAKITAIVTILISAIFPLYVVDLPILLRVGIGLTLAAVILYIATRPSRPGQYRTK